jgi:hypothetical protein
MAQEKCTAFPAPILTKFGKCSTKARKIIVENRERKAFTPVKKHAFTMSSLRIQKT